MIVERGYDFSGVGIIKHNNQTICRINEISVHIYPERVFLTIEKQPAIPRLVKVCFSPILVELEILVEVGQFYYVVKDGKINKATLDAKKGEMVFVKEVEIVSFNIEMVPK